MRSNIWRGSISFGLINIPVTVQTAVQDHDLHFNLLDKRNLSRIKFNRINEKNGQAVPPNQIAKGYEFKKGKYILMTEKDFKDANPKASQMIEIENFVEQEDIDPMYFEKPYYLVPEKNAHKSYFLLQEALAASKRVAVAKIVMHQKEHLTCIFSRGKYLVLEILRFSHEIKNPNKVDYLKPEAASKAKPQELKMAQRLIDDMTGKWDPTQYKDTYFQDLTKHIQKRVAAGKGQNVERIEKAPREKTSSASPKDLMALLQASMKSKSKSKHMH